LALIRQVPTAVKVMVAAAMEQIEVEFGSMVRVTSSPEVAVAVTVYEGPPMVGCEGALEVNEML
jgi:hypothetical protein